MHPSYRLIKEVKRAAGGKIGAEGLRRSLAIIEGDCPAGALMSTLAADPFIPVMLDAAQRRPQPEILAWMTLAAAGPGPVRRGVAKRAADIVAPHELIDTLLAGGDLRASCGKRAESAPSEEEWGAWLLLSRLGSRQIQRLVERKTSLRRRFEAAKREARRPINPQLAGQLRALGLV